MKLYANDPDPQLAVLSEQFSDAFSAQYVDALADSDVSASTSTTGTRVGLEALIARMGVPIDDKFNGFESQSDSADDPALHAAPALLRRVSEHLDLTGLASSCGLTPQQIFNRAGAQSCGGCHEFSSNKPIASSGEVGRDFKWPASLGFVHINESSVMSPLLLTTLLPMRRHFLLDFLGNSPSILELKSMRNGALRTLRSPNMGRTMHDSKTLWAEEAFRIRALRDEDLRTPGAFMTFRPAD
jgi:hypothetical protein